MKYRPVYAYMIVCPKEGNKKQMSVKQQHQTPKSNSD